MLDIIVIIALVAVAGLVVFATSKPNSFRYERSIQVRAPAEKIFPFINDFHLWREWSPYEGRDPAMQRRYAGAERGKGAVYEWEGKRAVGSGRMEIVESSPPSNIAIALQFTAPFRANNFAEFTLEPERDGVRVRWAMYGPNRFIGKVMSLFINMDRMIGRDFDAGLTKLKTLAET